MAVSALRPTIPVGHGKTCPITLRKERVRKKTDGVTNLKESLQDLSSAGVTGNSALNPNFLLHKNMSHVTAYAKWLI